MYEIPRKLPLNSWWVSTLDQKCQQSPNSEQLFRERRIFCKWMWVQVKRNWESWELVVQWGSKVLAPAKKAPTFVWHGLNTSPDSCSVCVYFSTDETFDWWLCDSFFFVIQTFSQVPEKNPWVIAGCILQLEHSKFWLWHCRTREILDIWPYKNLTMRPGGEDFVSLSLSAKVIFNIVAFGSFFALFRSTPPRLRPKSWTVLPQGTVTTKICQNAKK